MHEGANEAPRWARAGVLGGVLLALLFGGTACNRATCTHSSECEGSVCSYRGFCEALCRQDSDCPCGSFCSDTCGLCVRSDGAGLARCDYRTELGLATEEAEGACLRGLDTLGRDRNDCPGVATTPAPMCGADSGVPVGDDEDGGGAGS